MHRPTPSPHRGKTDSSAQTKHCYHYWQHCHSTMEKLVPWSSFHHWCRCPTRRMHVESDPVVDGAAVVDEPSMVVSAAYDHYCRHRHRCHCSGAIVGSEECVGRRRRHHHQSYWQTIHVAIFPCDYRKTMERSPERTTRLMMIGVKWQAGAHSWHCYHFSVSVNTDCHNGGFVDRCCHYCCHCCYCYCCCCCCCECCRQMMMRFAWSQTVLTMYRDTISSVPTFVVAMMMMMTNGRMVVEKRPYDPSVHQNPYYRSYYHGGYC